jgi:mannobiose 2-epimerase
MMSAKTANLEMFKEELHTELSSILDFWAGKTQDNINGGFVGRMDNEGRIIPGSPKGSVLNARILWSFSAAFNLNADTAYLEIAHRAYSYIADHFIDPQYGGVYWSVDAEGNPLDTKKQVYATAFTIYALSEYYTASRTREAMSRAISLYKLLLEKSYDREKTGYLEAFTREWEPVADLRLSAKDANEKKTMNTHLHVLEAYTALYRIWPDEELKTQVAVLLNNFFDHFIDPHTHHLRLFFDENWNSRSALVSYGHDIEATWLLLEAADAVGYTSMIDKVKKIGIAIAEATQKGLDADGGLWYEYEPVDDHLIKEKHWWVQAEAMVGFYNAWQINGDERYLDNALKSWQFIKNNILDKTHGEWLWGVDAKGHAMAPEDKVGIWKCPYHNSRACIEIIKRISEN